MTISQGAITLTLEKALDIMNTVGFCQGVLYVLIHPKELRPSIDPIDAIESCCLTGSIRMAARVIGAGLPAEVDLAYRSFAVVEDVLHLTEESSLSNWNDVPRRTRTEVIVALEKSVALSMAREK